VRRSKGASQGSISLFSTVLLSGLVMSDSVPELDEFLKNVGMCITDWSFIEDKLFELCYLSLKAPRVQASIVYYRTPTIDSRLSLVDELITAVLPKKKSGEHSGELEIKWKKILAEIKELLPERNALAHYPVKEIISVPENFLIALSENYSKRPRKYSAIPHKNEQLRGRKGRTMDADMLPKHLQKLGRLEFDLHKFGILFQKIF
jgi:hypothetical protein